MAEIATKLKAELKEGVTEVKTIITGHPMESGLRTDKDTGKVVPAHFIEEIAYELNGKVIFSGIWSGGVSPNPYCAFKFKNGKAGDKLKVKWKDNKGETGESEVEIK